MSDEAVIDDDGKITCLLDNARCHSIQVHLKRNHPEITIEDYKSKYPEAPLLSEWMKRQIKARQEAKKSSSGPSVQGKTTKRPLYEVFDLTKSKAVKNGRGDFIEIDVFSNHEEEENAAIVPDVDPNYVFDVELVKTVIIGLTLNIPVYLWGYHGSGKTTALEQVCARTNRPFQRVQHTVNTEEAHILGQWIIDKDRTTSFQLGPLPMAMILGQVYCADEYDFALPSVISVYQPVLEGKPLVIKDAPPELRVIRPHKNFRFVATGNTNGCGDETGLYQGTNIQNAASYSRFGITEEVKYMKPAIEKSILASQANITVEAAERFIEFAGEVREMFMGGRIGTTISTRELITAARLGVVHGRVDLKDGGDWKRGLQLGFANRLSRIDRETIEQYMQRIFG